MTDNPDPTTGVAETLNEAINVELLNRVQRLRGVAHKLALATGELIVATDGQEAIRAQRQAALDAITETDAALGDRT